MTVRIIGGSGFLGSGSLPDLSNRYDPSRRISADYATRN
jgi:hypothetical protein